MTKTQEAMYKETLKKNEKKTYADYISENGIRAEQNYYDKITASMTEKALGNTNYGTKSSELYTLGLSESGYEDYLKNNLEKHYSAAIQESMRGLLSEEYRNKSSYEKYVSAYTALQDKISKSVIADFSKGNDFSYENAYAKAVNAGISKEFASYTASSAVRAAINNTMEKAITFAKANNLSPKTAKSYAKSLGLDEIYAEKVYNSISTFTKEEKDFYSSMSAENYYNYIMSQAK